MNPCLRKAGVILVVSTCLFLSAQTNAAQPANATPSSSPITVTAGEPIQLALKKPVSSETSMVGDIVELEVIKSLMIDGMVLIDEGTSVSGKVVIAEHRKRKGVGGELAITFEGVRAATGELLPLSGSAKAKGSDKRAEIDANIGDTTMATLGVGLPFTPLFLLQKGGAVQLELGTRFTAFVATDHSFDREEIQKHQPSPATNISTIYLFNSWHPTCGSLELPFDAWQKGAIRLDLPPGRYWFHSGASGSLLRGIMAGTVTGFSFGMASPSPVSNTKVLKRPITEFVALDLRAGETHYLQAYDIGYAPKRGLKVISAEEAETLLEKASPFYWLRNITPESLQRLKAQPLKARTPVQSNEKAPA